MKKSIIIIFLIAFLFGCEEEDFVNVGPPPEVLETVSAATVTDNTQHRDYFTVETDSGVELDVDNPDLIVVEIGDRVLINVDLESDPNESEWFISRTYLEEKII